MDWQTDKLIPVYHIFSILDNVFYHFQHKFYIIIHIYLWLNNKLGYYRFWQLFCCFLISNRLPHYYANALVWFCQKTHINSLPQNPDFEQRWKRCL